MSREVRENASEVKFLVTEALGRDIRERARELLGPDPWATGPTADEYQTTTIYFDTQDFAVYNRRGSFRRAKYRIRRYGEGQFVFLERKLRTNDLLTKRRSSVRIDDLPLLMEGAPATGWPGDWFRNRLRARHLGVVCQVRYQRTARVGMTDCGPIRLTVDNGLLGCAIEEPGFSPTQVMQPISDATIVEMKFRAGMPAVFKRIVEEFSLEPVRVSKYRLAMEQTRAEALHA